MASYPQVCGLLPPPDRNDALRAVSSTILKIRRLGLSAKDIARSLYKENGEHPDPDTILRAEKGNHMLGFDLLAQLAFKYGEAADPIRMLLEPAPTGEPTTLEDRLERIEREAAAIRQEIKR